MRLHIVWGFSTDSIKNCFSNFLVSYIFSYVVKKHTHNSFQDECQLHVVYYPHSRYRQLLLWTYLQPQSHLLCCVFQRSSCPRDGCSTAVCSLQSILPQGVWDWVSMVLQCNERQFLCWYIAKLNSYFGLLTVYNSVVAGLVHLLEI